MTPLEATGQQTFYGKSHILRHVGLTVTLCSIMGLTLPRSAAAVTVQAAYLGNAA